MRYCQPYIIERIGAITISKALAKVNTQLEDAKIVGASGQVRRSTKVDWINDKDVLTSFLEYAQAANKNAGWDFHIDVIEPLQYAEYSVEDEFGWHIDQHNKPYDDGRVRKISFSIFLNDDYEGGEFDIETGNPQEEKRYTTIKRQPNTGFFFQSHYWHRVRPITKGVRKSLVGWVLGPKFK
jgi:PKHD-type hydroxylase